MPRRPTGKPRGRPRRDPVEWAWVSWLELLEQAEEVRAELIAEGVKKPKKVAVAQRLRSRLVSSYKANWVEAADQLADKPLTEMTLGELIDFMADSRTVIAREYGPSTETVRRYLNLAEEKLREDQSLPRQPRSVDFLSGGKVVVNGKEMSAEDAAQALAAWLEAIGANVRRN